MFGSVCALENAIRSSISIPAKLQNNCRITTTGMGGVFIEYYSDSSSNLNMLNSKVLWKMFFDTTGRFGSYNGDIVGVEMTQCRGIRAMRGVKTKKPWEDVVAKVNKWIAENEEFLYSSIVNK